MNIYFPSYQGISYGIKTIIAAIDAYPSRVLTVIKFQHPSEGGFTPFSFAVLFLGSDTIGQMTALINIRGTATGYTGTGSSFYKKMIECLERHDIFVLEYYPDETKSFIKKIPNLGLGHRQRFDKVAWEDFFITEIITDTFSEWANKLQKKENIEKVEKTISEEMSDIADDNDVNSEHYENIRDALLNISEPLAKSYVQIKRDIADTKRISWAGTAHEIREIVATLLRILAPDNKVKEQSWYKNDANSSNPTQKQRVKYILQQNQAGSKESEAINLIVDLEELISNIVRATYSRASDAAHRHKSREEVNRILQYFEVFIQDLLKLK